MSGAAEQLRRILTLIPLVADGESHSIEEVARSAGTDPDTLMRDVRLLSERFDVPGGFVEGLEIFLEADGLQVHTSHFHRPMRLTIPELSALELGLSLLAAERPPEERPPIARARERLRQAIARLPSDDGLDQLSHAGLTPPPDPRQLALLRAALRRRRKVRFDYQKSGATTTESRTACPFAIVYASGKWYLIGHCDEAADLRIFRLDRLTDPVELDQPYTIPEDFAVDRVLKQDRAFAGDTARTLEVRYSPRIARWIAEREGRAVAADGSLVSEYPLADLDWAVSHVLQYGPEAEVLAPEDVREAVARRLDELLRAPDP